MPRPTPRSEQTPPPAEPAAEPFADARAIIAPDPGVVTIEPAKARAALHTSGDLDIEPNADVTSSVSTDAALRVARGARLRSDARAGTGASIGEGARIDGALEVQGKLAWAAGARAGSVRLDGAFVTSDGLTRATRIRATHGIRPGGGPSGGGAP